MLARILILSSPTAPVKERSMPPGCAGAQVARLDCSAIAANVQDSGHPFKT